MNQTPSIIGKTLELYEAKVIGNPKMANDSPVSLAVLTIVTNVGWSNIPPSIIAKYGLHLNFLAAEFAKNIGKK